MPYDADHVLKLDLEQEKLVQVLKLFFFSSVSNDPLFFVRWMKLKKLPKNFQLGLKMWFRTIEVVSK